MSSTGLALSRSPLPPSAQICKSILHQCCVHVGRVQCTWCEMSTSRRMSQICMRGLVGDSSITSRVWPGLRDFSNALHGGSPIFQRAIPV